QRFNGSTISRMTLPFAILAVVTLAGAIAAMSLRNLVHCALCLVATFGGLAGLFLQLGAQFVGLAQILVYIGAVAILIVFALLLTAALIGAVIIAMEEQARLAPEGSQSH